MKRLFPFLLLFLAIGCDLPTYVGNPETAKFDERLPGIWYMSQSHEEGIFYVYKLNEHQVLVQWYGFEPKGDKTKPQLIATFSGWTTAINDQTYLSLRAFDPSMLTRPDSPQSNAVYDVLRLKFQDDTISADDVSGEFLKKYDVKTPEAFEAALREHGDEAGVFTGGGLTLNRVDPKQPGAAGKFFPTTAP